jgi:hypothetical protein
MDIKIGRWAFIVAVILAVLAGVIPSIGANAYVPWVLAILGLVVGLLNITEKESTGFLIATVALVISSATLGPLLVNDMVASVLKNIVLVAGPAAFIVAIKHLYAAAAD